MMKLSQPVFRYMLMPFCFLIATLSTLSAHSGDDWSRFRGPNGSGLATAKNLPTTFGPDNNVVWKTELPAGHSSPIISNGRIFLTGFAGDSLITFCLEQKTGEILWQRLAPQKQIKKIDARNNAASPTPVADGKNVFVFFADYGLISYDFDGKLRWEIPLGPFENVYGMGASPILSGNNVVLVCDQNLNSHIVAFDKDSGKQVWKTERSQARSGHSTPILLQAADKQAQLLVPGSFLLTAYAAKTGKKEWWVNGLSFEMKSTPVMQDGLVFINGYGSPLNQPENMIEVPTYKAMIASHDKNGDGAFAPKEVKGEKVAAWFPAIDLDGDKKLNENEWNYYRAAMASKNGMLAIQTGGSGDMSAQNIRWQYHKSVPQLPSPLIYKNVLYMISDRGVVTSFNPKSGEVIKRGRLEGAVDSYYASPVAADDKIYFASRSGKVAVVSSDGQFEVQSVNIMDGQCYATPAIADNKIYIRTTGALYCFGR